MRRVTVLDIIDRGTAGGARISATVGGGVLHRERDEVAAAVDVDDVHIDFLADIQHIGDGAHTLLRQFDDVNHALDGDGSVDFAVGVMIWQNA